MTLLCLVAAVAAVLSDGMRESGYARLDLDGSGAIRSLCETDGGRELIAKPQPMVVTVGKDGRRTVSDAVKLSVEIAGPIANPMLTVGADRRRFPVALAAKEKLVFDGAVWFVRGSKGKLRIRGTFDTALPILTGVTSVSLAADDAASAFAQVRLFKRYD